MGTGILQTFVFARVLGPDRFSLFIFFAALGYSLPVADAGMVKVLFVDLRARFLQNKAFAAIVGQATGLVVLYFVITALATAMCFLLLEVHFDYSLRDSTELTLFFAFNAVNLPWIALRYFSIAIDEFYFFETLEALRRGLSMIALLALLLGLPVFAFLVLINCAWIVGFCIAIAKLYERGVLGGTFAQ